MNFLLFIKSYHTYLNKKGLIVFGHNFEIPVIVVPVVGAGQIFTAGESAGERGLAARVR